MQSQGIRGILGMQYEATYGVVPTADTPAVVADLTKVYFESEGLKGSRNLVSSNIISGRREATKPLQGNIDVQGSIATELGATLGTLLYGVCGSVATTKTSGTETLGAALTTPTGTIDPYQQTLTVSSATHGLAVGDIVQITGITIPTALNDKYFRVIKVPTAGSFVLRIQKGVSGTFTLGSGALKKLSSATTPAYTHTIVAGGVLPSFYIEKGFPDISQYFQYSGCKINKMSLNLVPEGVQKVSFDFVGKDETVASTSYDSTPTDPGKKSFSGNMIASLTENSSGNNLSNKVTKMDITLENSLDTGVYCIGGASKRGALPEGMLKVTGTLEMIFEDTTLYAKAVSGTKTDLYVQCTIGTGAGTNGNEGLGINIQELVFKQDTPVISGDKGVLVSLPFEGFYDTLGTISFSLLTPAFSI